MDNKQDLIQLISAALKEDIGNGDHSTLCCIDKNEMGKAILKVKQECVLAGVDIARVIFSKVDANIEFNQLLADGTHAKMGDIAFEIKAPIHVILSCERLVLNTMQMMSGIATLTNKYVAKLKPYKSMLLDSRKTTPNFRLLIPL